MTARKHPSLNRIIVVVLLLAISGALVAAFSNGRLAAITVVLALAFAKGWFVILDFLEMRGKSGALKPALLAWPALLLTLAFARSVAVGLFF